MTPNDEMPPTSDDTEERPALDRRVIVIRVVGLVVLVLLFLPVFSTLQARYYERYPDMRPAITYWRDSTHGLMSCADCHVEPGVKGFVGFGARSVPAFYSQLVNGPQKTNILGAPSTLACQKCHTSYRKVSPGGDLLIPHAAHVEVLNIECVQCHKQLVHFKNTEGVNSPKMTLCMSTCHDGKKAKDECTACHTDKSIPESHKRPDWNKVHSQETKKENCSSCHAWSPNYCADCHKKRPNSHAGNFKKAHAPRAKTEGTKGCMFCHAEEFCKKCH